MTLTIEIDVPDGAVQFLDATIVLVNAKRANFDPPLPAFTREEFVFAVTRDNCVLELQTERRELASAESQVENVEILDDFNNG